jgi:hypothetical protein
MNSTRQFRDPSAWMHIVVACDTTQSTDAHKIRLYINGSEETSFSGDNRSTIADSSDLAINANSAHSIGTYVLSPSSYFDGYMAEVNFVDGTQLTPASFGETKAGIWIPKDTSGLTFGTNGFRLTFAEAGDLGADSSYTVNDIFGDSSAIATYLFDGSIVDAGGNYNGTTANVTFTDGIVGTQAGVFNGTNAKWEANTHLLGAHATDISVSISGWFQVSSNYQYLITDGNAGTGGGYFAVYPQGNGYLEAATGHASNGNNITVTGSEVVTDGEWHHFAFTKTVSGGTATGKLWVDGNYAGSDTTTDSTAYSNETAFAWFAYANIFYTCVLDQIRIFNRGLTDAEVQRLAGGYGLDSSGGGNTFTPVNLQSTDVVLDSPTNSWCTLNPLALGTDGTLTEGSLNIAYGSSSTRTMTTATMGVSSGKWYWEVRANADGGEIIGITNISDDTGIYPGVAAGSAGYYGDDGSKYVDGSNSSYGASFTTGDIIGFALDMDAGTLVAYKNNSSQGTLASSLTGDRFPAIGDGGAGGTTNNIFNFGQDSSFAGTETAQGNTDGNGNGDFFYAPPSDHLALCSASLPNPAIDPAQDEEPADNFDTQLWTGTGSGQTFSNFTFQPDWLWFKNRNGGSDHAIFDSVRGVNAGLTSNNSNTENTAASSSQDLVSFDSDGFTTGTPSQYGSLGSNTLTIVTWAWKGGGSASSNSDGDITSSVSANTEAGFSIVSWTADGTTNNRVGHGLSSAPEAIIYKDRTGSGNWHFWTTAVDGTNDYLLLNSTQASNAISGSYTSPTATTISTYGYSNTLTMIAYCFHRVDGYCDIGTFTGNGSSDGTFVFTGLRPSFLLIKRTDTTGNWYIMDNKRNPFNEVDNHLYPNLASAESASSHDTDFLSNGFKARGSAADLNASGGTYVYLAIAEQPFKYANAR